MARFDDYHRTVIGYHGTSLAAALRIVNRVETFRASERDYDWLGRGIYFWEYSPDQALEFARIRQRQIKAKRNKSADDARRATEPLAVVASMIRLGHCLDLTEPANVRYLEDVFGDYQQSMALTGDPLPRNTRKYRRLDCDVFEFAYKRLEGDDPPKATDTARGIYVPAGGKKRVWGGSWISKDTHIQLCVRNSANILGTWLHYPPNLGANDARKALDAADVQVGLPDPQVHAPAEEEADGMED